MPLAQAYATLQDYRGHLLMLRAWLAPIEQWLGRFDDGPQGPRWRAFSEALREQVRGGEQIDEACAGACAAFDRVLALRGMIV